MENIRSEKPMKLNFSFGYTMFMTLFRDSYKNPAWNLLISLGIEYHPVLSEGQAYEYLKKIKKL